MSKKQSNLRRTHGFEALRVEGEIPSDLRGTLYRVGPGLVERFGKSVHPFMADGAITAVRLGKNITGAHVDIKSDKFLEEEKAGHAIYDSNASLPRRIFNGLTGKIKSTGNTNILPWQGRIYAMMEASLPVAFDPLSLETGEVTDFGVIKASFSAHPHRVESLKTTFNFGVRGKRIDLYALADIGEIRCIGSFMAPWASLIHDFTVTTKHAIFFIDPSKLVVWRAMFSLKDFEKYFQWDPKRGLTIIVVPLDSPNIQHHIEVDAFRVWHFANAYEDGDDIVIDAIRHDDIGALGNPVDTTEEDANPELWRYRINPRKKSFSETPLWQEPCEFPSVHSSFVGEKHRFIWLETYKNKGGNTGFSKFDTQTGLIERWEAPDDVVSSEPLFIPGKDSEDAGWVLQMMHDHKKLATYLAITDGQKIADGPVAKLWFDHLLPLTFHGAFVQDDF